MVSGLGMTSYAWHTLCIFCLLLDAESTKDGKSQTCSLNAPKTKIIRWFYQRDCWTNLKIESIELLLNQCERVKDTTRYPSHLNRQITIKHFSDVRVAESS